MRFCRCAFAARHAARKIKCLHKRIPANTWHLFIKISTQHSQVWSRDKVRRETSDFYLCVFLSQLAQSAILIFLDLQVSFSQLDVCQVLGIEFFNWQTENTLPIWNATNMTSQVNSRSLPRRGVWVHGKRDTPDKGWQLRNFQKSGLFLTWGWPTPFINITQPTKPKSPHETTRSIVQTATVAFSFESDELNPSQKNISRQGWPRPGHTQARNVRGKEVAYCREWRNIMHDLVISRFHATSNTSEKRDKQK